MKKTLLKNELRVIYQQSNSNIITINISILAGSIYETSNNNGISHLIEHMVFEGTKTRSCQEISREIERYGGELNAYTSSDRTNYYIKIHKKHAEKAIEILSDIIINPLFQEKALKKEKNVVIEEISMINDEPRHYQWILLIKTLFDPPFASPTYGIKETIMKLARHDIVNYHKKYYTPRNTIITIVGRCNNYLSLISKYFIFKNRNSDIRKPSCKLINKRKSATETRNINQHYLTIGYRTPKRFSKESYVLDVIEALLAKGQSGSLFKEIRTKRGLTYDLGVYHNPSSNHGFFAFYSSAQKEKIPKIEKIFFSQLRNLRKTTVKELEEAKSYIEGNLAIKTEDSHEMADIISYFEQCGDCYEYNNYIKKIHQVTVKDIIRVQNKYFNQRYTRILIK